MPKIMTDPPVWPNPGERPPEHKIQTGWEITEHPPAPWFNWLFNRIYQALLEIDEVAAGAVQRGTENTGVELVHSLIQSVDTRSVEIERTASGDISVVRELAGSTLVRKTTFDYDAAGNVASVVELLPGIAEVTTTLEYGPDGEFLGAERDVEVFSA